MCDDRLPERPKTEPPASWLREWEYHPPEFAKLQRVKDALERHVFDRQVSDTQDHDD